MKMLDLGLGRTRARGDRNFGGPGREAMKCLKFCLKQRAGPREGRAYHCSAQAIQHSAFHPAWPAPATNPPAAWRVGASSCQSSRAGALCNRSHWATLFGSHLTGRKRCTLTKTAAHCTAAAELVVHCWHGARGPTRHARSQQGKLSMKTEREPASQHSRGTRPKSKTDHLFKPGLHSSRLSWQQR